MTRKKKVFRLTTIACPQHGLPLKVQRDGARLFAVCNCNVTPNPWSGKVVFQRYDKGA